MLIRFFLREPGNHHEIAAARLPAVPRVSEYVIIDDVVRPVHAVFWDVASKEASVELNP
jgi:hypothetical protein